MSGPVHWWPAWVDNAWSTFLTYWPLFMTPILPILAVWKDIHELCVDFVSFFRGKKNERKKTLIEQEGEELVLRRKQLSADSESYLNRLEADNERLRRANDRLQAALDLLREDFERRVEAFHLDLERGWNLARQCWDGWWNATHGGNNVLGRVQLSWERGEAPPDPFPSFQVPAPLETLPGRKAGE